MATSATRVLICESGAGKTYTVERFKNTLRAVCENYSELHDFLVLAMREANEMGSLTERFFRIKYRLPVKTD